uniref:Uncharacterized protein n=1 Tax=Salix viminalis TaxID=40686 RepID=A0A6N2K989_SALVM
MKCNAIILVATTETLNSKIQKKNARETDLIAVVERERTREEGKYVFFGETEVSIRREEMEQILIIRRQLVFPNGIGRSGSSKSTVQSSQIANLRRRQVHENTSHAALRYVPQPRTTHARSLRQVR